MLYEDFIKLTEEEFEKLKRSHIRLQKMKKGYEQALKEKEETKKLALRKEAISKISFDVIDGEVRTRFVNK